MTTRASDLVRVADLASAWAKIAHRLPLEAGSEAVIIIALQLAVAWLSPSSPTDTLDGNGDTSNSALHVLQREDGRHAFERALQVALDLSRLVAAGAPLGTDAIAAAILAEVPHLDLFTIRLKCGDAVAALVHDIHRVRDAPSRVDTFNDSVARYGYNFDVELNRLSACGCAFELVHHLAELQAGLMNALPCGTCSSSAVLFESGALRSLTHEQQLPKLLPAGTSCGMP
jgi:hypothetical protein